MAARHAVGDCRNWHVTRQNGRTTKAGRTELPTPQPGPDRPHLSERGSAVSIMLPSESDGNNGAPGWRARDLTPQSVAPLLERFGWYHEQGEPDECWIWGGPYNKLSGYGQVSRSSRHPEGQHVLAHRLAWVAATGEALTNDITIDHLCVNQLCVNPGHMEPVSLSVNATRRNRRPDGERAYPKLTKEAIKGARTRAAERVAQLRQEKIQRDRAASVERRAEAVPCLNCGRAIRRASLPKHQAAGCPPLGRRRKNAPAPRPEVDLPVCMSRHHGGCGMARCRDEAAA